MSDATQNETMDGQVSYTCCTPLKRESIVRMMMVSQKNTSEQQSVSLVLVSAKGRVAVYDLSMKLTAAFTLRLSSAPVASIKPPSVAAGTSSKRPISAAASAVGHNATSSQKVQLNGWITDCVHMDDFNSLVVASSGRCLHFYTTVVTPFAERFRLDGMKDIPTSLSYMAPGGGRLEPLLGIGDDGGDVFVLRFLKASTSLFKKREIEGEIQHVYWRELHLQAGMVSLTILPGSHDSPVLQIDLKPAMQRVVSCSKNSNAALLIRHTRPQSGVEGAPIPPVTLRTGPGITCFDYDEERGLVVTGSTDSNIRLWSPTNLAKPWMILTGHTATIATVCLVKNAEFLWSICDHAELRHWDLTQGKCVDTIDLAFTGRKENRVQFSQRPLLATEHTLFIACSDYVASVQLDQATNRGQSRVLETLLGRVRNEENEGTGMSAESKIPYRYREGLLEFGYHGEDDVFKKFITDLKRVFTDSENVSQRLREVERAGIKSLEVLPCDKLVAVYDWEPELASYPPLDTKTIPLNLIKLKELEGVDGMKKHVKEGTPLCGLRLHEPNQIELPKGLPVTNRMKRHGIKSFSTLAEVRVANFNLFSDQTLSLSSARTSLASSILSYYRQKKVGDKAMFTGEDLLTVSNRSSRKSSASSLSPHSSAASIDGHA